jgi:hydroxymethylglutaryl-CoA reductase
MPSPRLAVFPLVCAITLSACQADPLQTEFVASCHDAMGANASNALCTCIYKGLKDEFSDDQLRRIPDLFAMTITDAANMLRQSGNKSDLDISERVHDIEIVTETCFKQSG